jgi:cytochrome c peroxidase
MTRSRPWVPINLPGRCRWIYIGTFLLCVTVIIAATAIAQVPLDLLKNDGPLANQEPITPIPAPPAADPLKLALGERLFSDARLSGHGTLACSSCHNIRTNGARSNDGTVSRPFDTLTVFNAVLSFRLNWEGNFRTPAAHVVSSLENPVNMRSSVDEVVRKLNADPTIVSQFRAAYGGTPNGGAVSRRDRDL